MAPPNGETLQPNNSRTKAYTGQRHANSSSPHFSTYVTLFTPFTTVAPPSAIAEKIGSSVNPHTKDFPCQRQIFSESSPLSLHSTLFKTLPITAPQPPLRNYVAPQFTPDLGPPQARDTRFQTHHTYFYTMPCLSHLRLQRQLRHDGKNLQTQPGPTYLA